MIKSIKIVLAILLFLCLMNMPYGFYEFVRVASLLGFSLLAYNSYKSNHMNLVIVYIGLALLFQPFFKVALGRLMWNIIDVVVGVFLVISIFTNNKKSFVK